LLGGISSWKTANMSSLLRILVYYGGYVALNEIWWQKWSVLILFGRGGSRHEKPPSGDPAPVCTPELACCQQTVSPEGHTWHDERDLYEYFIKRRGLSRACLAVRPVSAPRICLRFSSYCLSQRQEDAYPIGSESCSRNSASSSSLIK
jgi:hypothetical protein